MQLTKIVSRAAVCVTTFAIVVGGCGDDDPSGDPDLGASGMGTSTGDGGGGEPPSSGGEGGGQAAGNAGTSASEGGQQAGAAAGADGEAGASAGAPSPNGGASGAAGVAGEGGSGSNGCLVDSQCSGQSCVGGTPGTLCLPPHVACASHADCAIDEYCDGYCRAAALLSAPCSPGNRCGKTEVLPDHRVVQMFCLAGTCSEPLLVGKDCPDWEGSQPDVCEVGTSCSRSLVDPNTITCKPWGKAGDFCDFGRRCDPSHYCLRDLEFESVCVERPGLGELCGPNFGPCDEGQYCDYVESACRLSPADGEPCATQSATPPLGAPLCDPAADTGCSPCALGFFCQAGVCRPRAAEGTACDSTPCERGLSCVSAVLGGACDG